MAAVRVIIVTAFLISLVKSETFIPVTSSWYGGFQAAGCVPIFRELTEWRAHLFFSNDVHSIDIEVAISTKINGRNYLLENQKYNGHLVEGDQLCISFTGDVTGNTVPSVSFCFEDYESSAPTSCPSIPTTTPTPSTQNATSTPSTQNATSTPSTQNATSIPNTPATTPIPSTPSATPIPSTPSTTPIPSTPSTTPIPSTPSTTSSATHKDYGDALGKSILFYNAQRSGKLPANNSIPWRGDSALTDCVPGGWYDAGDHVKFGLPMASATTVLLWSLYAFKDGYVNAGQLDNMYDMIKWPLDYFLRAWNPTAVSLVAQIGDVRVDHAYWGRPEQMSMARPCQKINPSTPGSDVAAETSAALAVGSIIFQEGNQTTYSNQLLTAAKSLYAFAKSSRGWFTGAYPSYVPSGDRDELCVAGVWLYRATGSADYLNEAKGFAQTDYAWAFSWDDKKVACNQLLFEETQDSAYRNPVTSFFQHWLPGGDVAYTPCGLAWRDRLGPNRYAGNSAFLALISAQSGINTTQYRTWAIQQINYLLGDNNHDGGCFSFEIGYGKKYPQQPHHRGASCPDLPAACGDAQLNIDAPSPQILYGALVGGPDQSDNYVDRRTDSAQNDVATNYNSGFQGALAGINYLLATNSFPSTSNKCPCIS